MPVNLSQLAQRVTAIESRRRSRLDTDELSRTIGLMRATIPPAPEAEGAAEAAAEELGGIWRAQRYHAKQAAAFYSPARFRAIEAGRRSGKSYGRKVEIVTRALDPDWQFPERNIVVGARTDAQAKRLYWNDLQRMIPQRFIRAVRPSKDHIETVTGAIIYVLGMDKPQRAEGIPIDDLFLDEYADVPPTAFDENLGPALATPGRPAGSATLFGTPDMRSGEHFIKLCDEWSRAQREGDPDYAHYRWTSEGIVSDAEIEGARKRMTRASFLVEFMAERVTTGNRAYYEFQRETHCHRLLYVPTRSIAFCLDFNVAPGVAAIIQEQSWHDYTESGRAPTWAPDGLAETFTAVIGEVWIPEDSNTAAVTRKFLDVFGGHRGNVMIFGDATGGARGTAKLDGSDWDIVRRMLWQHFGRDRVIDRVPSRNPAERKRVNAVNSALRNANGTVSLLVDPEAAPHVVRDLERVTLLEGGSGELHKPSKGPNSDLTHMCFDGSTLVETPKGIVAMRDLPKAGMVRGPFGEFVRYEAAGLTIPSAPMVDVVTDGVGVIQCTPWHQMLTRERGWVRADQSAGLTLVLSSETTGPRSFSVSSTAGRVDTLSIPSGGSIASSTRTTTGRYRRGESGTSTTRTVTAGTTSRKTWSLSRLASTCRTIIGTLRRSAWRSSESICADRGRWLPRGTAAQRAGLGTASTREGRRGGVAAASARFAGMRSTTSSRRRSSAQRSARPLPAAPLVSTTSTGSARSAGARSASADTPEPRPAGATVVSVSDAGATDAYCLWQPDFGCFALASGVVVSNSDSLGYGVIGSKGGTTRGPQRRMRVG